MTDFFLRPVAASKLLSYEGNVNLFIGAKHIAELEPEKGWCRSTIKS
jgi:hypothetical protein